jgi:hypothetical protein
LSAIENDLEIGRGQSSELEGSYELEVGMIYQPETRVESPSLPSNNGNDFHVEEVESETLVDESAIYLADSDGVVGHEDCLDNLPSYIAPGPSQKKVRASSLIASQDSGVLNCYYTNACSLNKKLLELQSTVDSFGYDILFLSETWYDEKSVTFVKNYKIFSKNRPKESGKSRGGGVAIYVKDELMKFSIRNYVMIN